MGHAAAHDEHHEHITPLKTYYIIYGALLVLTVATVGVSVLAEQTGMEQWLSLTIAMAVALTKATLVCAWFMHLAHDVKFNIIVFLSAAWFVTLFFVFTMFDVGTRGAILDIQDYEHMQVAASAEAAPAEAAPAEAAPAEAAPAEAAPAEGDAAGDAQH